MAKRLIYLCSDTRHALRLRAYFADHEIDNWRWSRDNQVWECGRTQDASLPAYFLCMIGMPDASWRQNALYVVSIQPAAGGAEIAIVETRLPPEPAHYNLVEEIARLEKRIEALERGVPFAEALQQE